MSITIKTPPLTRVVDKVPDPVVAVGKDPGTGGAVVSFGGDDVVDAIVAIEYLIEVSLLTSGEAPFRTGLVRILDKMDIVVRHDEVTEHPDIYTGSIS